MIARRCFFVGSRLRFFLTSTLMLWSLAGSNAVILFRTGDISANTSEPSGELAGSGWQFEGEFGQFLASPIAPHFFLTAQHIGSSSTFSFRGSDYTILRSFDDFASDLRIYEVAETFPLYAPLYSGSDEIGRHIVVVGRGTQRGPERVVSGQARGWDWGVSDFVRRWGENQVADIARSETGSDLLYARFDSEGLPNEAHLSAGDSGGGVFLKEGGVWRLAGINYSVDSFSSTPNSNTLYNGALFDERGFYTLSGSLIGGHSAVPSGFYASRISSRIGWITSVISPALENISARLPVRSGDEVAICGFIIQGTPGQSKRLVVRGLGPSLQAGGTPLAQRLIDPVVELHNASGGLIFLNDNWQNSQGSEIENSGLAPSDNREAAIVATLPAGSYTAVLRDKEGRSGTGLIEVYDIDRVGNELRLRNLSARCYVGTGDDVLIGGLIVRSVSKRLLLRALGSELKAFGVVGALDDPVLALHDANGVLVTSNDNWGDAPNAGEITATGLAPSDSHASAILTNVGSGAYTAIVRGAGDAAGIALLEAFLLD